MRLVRAMVEHAGGKLHEARGIVPIGVLRAVIAIADAPEEKLRLAALEVLGELSEPILEGMAADVDEVLMCEIRVVQSCGTWRFLSSLTACAPSSRPSRTACSISGVTPPASSWWQSTIPRLGSGFAQG